MVAIDLECLLRFFDIFGYNSGSSYLSSHRKIAHFIYIIHILLAIFYTLFKIHLIFGLFSTFQLIERINSVFQYSSALYCYWLIIFDSIFYRQEHQIVWKILKKINAFNFHQFNSTFDYFVLKSTEYFCVTFLSIVVVGISSGISYEIALVYHVLVKICEVRAFYYIFCIEILNSKIQTINSELNENKNNSNFWLNSKAFQRIREFYDRIYEMSNSLNEVFGLSQVATILYFFYRILTDLNWMQAHLHEVSPLFTLGIF